MAERRPDPPEPRASLVDSGWSEPAPAPERELPAYEDTARDHLVTRVDDQIQARIAAMNVEERTEVTSSPLSAPPPTTRTSPRSSPRAAAQAPSAAAVAPSAAPVIPSPAEVPMAEEVTSSVVLPSSVTLAHAVKGTGGSPMAPSAALKTPIAAAPAPRAVAQVTRAQSQQVPRPPVPPPQRRPSVVPPAAPPLPAAPPRSSPVAARQAPLPELVAAPVEERTLVDREPPGGEPMPFEVLTAPPKPPSAPPPRYPSIPPPKPSSLPPPPPFAPLHAPAAVPAFVPPPAIGAALREEVRVFGAEMPLWGVVGPLVVVTGLVCAFAGGWLGSVPKPAAEPVAAPSAVSSPSTAPAVSPGAASETAAASAPSSGSLVERARAGEERAVSVLEHQRPEQRTAEEAVALSAGKSAQAIAAVTKLRSRLAADPGLARDPKVIADLRRYAQDSETSRDALAAMAALPGALSADLLYDAWTSTADRSQTTELAQALLTSRDVRPKASPALAVALDLREAETCEANARILPRAIEVGDKRAFAPLARLLRRTGCGPSKHDDCFACVREGDALKNALNATKLRREPELVRREGLSR
jgi:hypothetical protein